MKLLIHVCCAPCLIYPLRQLRSEGFKVEGVFYNPNIHPFLEYKKRKEAVEAFSKAEGVDIMYPDYNPDEFFQAVTPYPNPLPQGEREKRCSLCWQMRLEKTAVIAKENGFDCFSTTLLVSPYQNQGILKDTGDKAGKNTGMNFYYEDFRPGFRQAHQEARAKGIYCQNYCGCIYSEMERLKNRNQ